MLFINVELGQEVLRSTVSERSAVQELLDLVDEDVTLSEGCGKYGEPHHTNVDMWADQTVTTEWKGR